MASKADGTVYIDTAIETDGFVSGGKEIEAAARRMSKSVENIGLTAKTALQKQVDAFIKSNQAYAQQEQKVEALKKKIKELSETKAATKEFEEIGKQIDIDTAKLNRLQEAQEEFLAVGGKKSSTAYKKRELQIEKLRNSIEYAKAEQEELLFSGRAYTTPDTSVLKQKLAAEEQKAVQMQTALGTSYEALKAKIQSYGGEVPKAVQETGLLTAALSALKTAAHAPVSAIKALGKGIISLPKKIPGALINGFKSIGGVAKNAAAAVGGKLLSGLKKAGSAIFGLNKGANSSGSAFGGGLKAMLKYGIGVRSLLALVNRLRGSLVEGFQNLAQYSGTTNQSISSLMSALTQLKNSFATAFAPILNVVAPILTKFINMISQAVTYVGMFIAALTGQTSFTKATGVQQDYAASLNDTAAAAENAKEASDDYLSGLDEIHRFEVQDAGSSSGSGSSGGVSPSDMFETIPIEPISFDSWGAAFSAFLDYLLNDGIPALKKALNSAATWINKFASNLYEMFSFPGVIEKVQRLGKEIATAFNDFVNQIDWSMIGAALGAGLNLAIQFLVNAIYNFDWLNLGASLALAVNNFINQIDWYSVGQLLWSKFKMALETLAGFLLSLDMTEVANALSQTIMGLFDSVTETIQNIDWEGLGNQVKEFLVNIDWAGIAKSVFSAIGAAFGAFASFLWGLIKDAWKKVVSWWKDTAYKDGEFTVDGLLNGISDAVKGIGAWIKEHIFQPFIDGFKSVFGIHSPSTVMAEMGHYIIEGLLEGISDFIYRIGEKFNEIKELVIGKLLETKDGAIEKAKEMLSGITGVIDMIKEKFRSGFESLVNIVKTPINWIISLINSLIGGVEAAQHWIADALSFDIEFPDIVQDLTGYSGFSLGVGKITLPRIPYLATGAVIPPNAPFMAMLGDQRHGNNIEAPEDLIRKIVREEAGGTQNGNAQYKFTAQINRRTLFEEMMTEAELVRSQTGVNPFEMA